MEERDQADLRMGEHWRGASTNRGGGGGQLRQLKSFNGCTSQIFLVTLTRILQARQQAPAGSTGCGYKCSLLLSAQGNCVCVWGVVVSSAWARGISWEPPLIAAGICQPSSSFPCC